MLISAIEFVAIFNFSYDNVTTFYDTFYKSSYNYFKKILRFINSLTYDNLTTVLR